MAKRFQRIYIEISNVCNLQCTFCPEVVREKKLMAPELFEQVLIEAKLFTDEVTFHLMGDPLLHPDLERLVELCAQHEMKIFLVTNGALLTEKRSQLLLHPAFRQISFSLHSFHDNFPGRDPSNYLEKIFEFTDRALRERPDLYLNYRLWNLDDPRGGATDNREILKRIEAHYQTEAPVAIDVRRKKSVNIRGRLYFHFDTEFVWPSLELPVLGTRGRCHGLSSHIGVLADGTVVPCCLDKEAGVPLGRMPEKNLKEILDGAKSMRILKGFQDGKLVEDLCQRCQYIERFQKAAPPAKTQQM